MLNIKIYIRIVFSSLMVLPIVILAYYIINFSGSSDCLSLYFKHKSVLVVKNIAWPDKGLLTLWFDSSFFVKNAKPILDLMNKYQFSGVISLSNGKSCASQHLSLNKLNMLQNQGWEITKADRFQDVSGERGINDMPAPDAKNLAIYDLSSGSNDVALKQFLKETKVRNGWIILYFHPILESQAEGEMSISKLDHILRLVRRSGIPVVLQEQVVKISR